MADENSDAEKKHAPTERRLRQAAERGDLVRSIDLPKAAATILTVTIILNASVPIGAQIERICATALQAAGAGEPKLAAFWLDDIMQAVLPLLVLVTVLSMLASAIFGGWTFSLGSLLPSFGKILSFEGMSEVFSVSGLTEALKSVVKFIIIGAVGGVTILGTWQSLTALGHVNRADGGSAIAIAMHVMSSICVAIAAIAVADMALQLWLYRRRHRMSDEEIREEMKEAVGNPQVRQRQRSAARRIARSRQMRRVPEASVVITNPTHIAVALRFRKGSDAAPILLAKGADLMAAEIIAKARSFGIPIVEAPPLARAVYRYVEPEDYIPVALYRACAEVLAYVWRLQAWRAGRGGMPKPPAPRIGEITMPARYGAGGSDS